MLISVNQSELNKLKIAAKIEGSMQMYYVITVSHREACKTGNCIRSWHSNRLQELHVSANKRCLEHSCDLFSS